MSPLSLPLLSFPFALRQCSLGVLVVQGEAGALHLVVHARHVVAVDGARRALHLYAGQHAAEMKGAAAASAAPPGSNQGLLAAASFDPRGAQELGGLSALR